MTALLSFLPDMHPVGMTFFIVYSILNIISYHTERIPSHAADIRT